MATIWQFFLDVNYEHTDAVRLRRPMALVAVVAGILVALSAAMLGRFSGTVVCMDNGDPYPETVDGVGACNAQCGAYRCFDPTDNETQALQTITVISVLLLVMSGVYFYKLTGKGDFHILNKWLTSFLLFVVGTSMIALFVASAFVLTMVDTSAAPSGSRLKQTLTVTGVGAILFALLGLLYPFLVLLRMLIAAVKYENKK
jgi:hypothetical protein